MGSKGPLVILFMGIIGISAFGMMANYVLRDPQTQRKIALKDALIAKYSLQDASLATKGGAYRLTLRVNTEPVADPAAAGELPQAFAGIDDFFLEHFEVNPPRGSLEVKIIDGESDTPRWQKTLRLEHAPGAQTKALQSLLGEGFRLEEFPESARIVVHLAKETSEQNSRRAAKQLARYRGLQWKRIEFRLDGRVAPYDAQGKPLAP